MIEYLNTDGTFDFVVSKPQAGWLGKSSEKQTPFVQLNLTVEGDEHAGEVTSWRGYLSDKAIDNTVDTLVKVFGFNGDLNELNSGPGFAGLKCSGVVEAEEYGGKTRYKVKWLNPPGYVHTPTGLDDSESKMLIAGLAGKVKAAAIAAKANAKPGAAPVKAASAPTQAKQLDDVPF